MIGTLVTPKDPDYGLPYLIAPNPDKIPDNVVNGVNSHHIWHPSDDEILQKPPEGIWRPSLDSRLLQMDETLGGWALRGSRLEEIDRDYHNHGPRAYHEHYAGPELPDSEDEQFRLIILCYAGLITYYGIDLKTGEPKEGRMDDKQMAILRKPKKNQAFGYENVRYDIDALWRFAVDYVLRQDLSHIKPCKVEEFLDPSTRNDRWITLGHLLLAKQVEGASEVVNDDYLRAKSEGLLDPRVQLGPQDLIKRLLGRSSRQTEVLLPALASRLRARQQQKAA